MGVKIDERSVRKIIDDDEIDAFLMHMVVQAQEASERGQKGYSSWICGFGASAKDDSAVQFMEPLTYEDEDLPNVLQRVGKTLVQERHLFPLLACLISPGLALETPAAGQPKPTRAEFETGERILAIKVQAADGRWSEAVFPISVEPDTDFARLGEVKMYCLTAQDTSANENFVDADTQNEASILDAFFDGVLSGALELVGGEDQLWHECADCPDRQTCTKDAAEKWREHTRDKRSYTPKMPRYKRPGSEHRM